MVRLRIKSRKLLRKSNNPQRNNRKSNNLNRKHRKSNNLNRKHRKSNNLKENIENQIIYKEIM